LAAAAAACLAEAQTAPAASFAELRSVRAWSAADSTRVVVELSRETKWKYGRLSNPERLFVDFLETHPRLGPRRLFVTDIGDALVQRARVAQKDPTTTRLVLDLNAEADYELSHLTNPERLVIEVRAKGAKRKQTEISQTEKAAPPVESAPPAAPPRRPPEQPRPEAGPRAGPEELAKAAPEPRSPAKPAVAERASPPAAEKPGARPAAGPEGRPESARRPEPAATPAAPREEVKEKPPANVPAAPPKRADLAADAATAPSGAAPLQPARPARDGTRSLTRALGLRIGRVVLDPGHGGHDEGTRGPGGLLEKELVLDVALRLGALIEERLGGEIVYTRQSDVFVPLEERTAIANEQRADLFLSIHANSSPIKRVSGAEVFYLNFTTSKEALDLAARENAGHGKSIFELRELIQKIALKDKLDESREFAGFVQRELSREWKRLNVTSRDRGVKKAPFVVLIGASMPSVLAEIGFLSNPRDEEMLKKSEFRGRLAEALYRGVERYAQSLGQTQALRAATPAATVQAQSMR